MEIMKHGAYMVRVAALKFIQFLLELEIEELDKMPIVADDNIDCLADSIDSSSEELAVIAMQTLSAIFSQRKRLAVVEVLPESIIEIEQILGIE